MKNSKCKNILISIGIWLMVVTILASVVVGAGYGLYLIVGAADKNQPIIDVVTVDKGDVLDKYDIDILKSDVINNKSIEKIITEFTLQKTLLIISLTLMLT